MRYVRIVHYVDQLLEQQERLARTQWEDLRYEIKERTRTNLVQAQADIVELERVEARLTARIDDLHRWRSEVDRQALLYLTREFYEERHTSLEKRMDSTTEALEKKLQVDLNGHNTRLLNLERWQANLIGRAVGLALVGSIFLAAVTAIVTHLLSAR